MAKKSGNIYLKKAAEAYLYTQDGYKGKIPDVMSVLCRASLLGYIRSATFAGKYIGMYISSESEELCGIQFVDFNGTSFDESWETCGDELVNSDENDFLVTINKIFRQQGNCRSMNDSIYGNILLGCDNRKNTKKVKENILKVLKEFRCNIKDYEMISKPELHFLTRKCNDNRTIVKKNEYIDYIATKFSELKNLTGSNLFMGIDTGNGVARINMVELSDLLPDAGIQVLNDESGDQECGHGHILSKKKIKALGSQCRINASFNEDMTRGVLFNESRYFDGDSQAVFLAMYLKSLLLKTDIGAELGVVMSVFSNSGATEYLKSRIKVSIIQGSFKDLAKEAKTYDVGVYFEPSGQGSVYFSKAIAEAIYKLTSPTPLKSIVELFEPSYSDALVNILVLKSCLRGLEELTPYREYFSRQLQVHVRDKSLLALDKNNRLTDVGFQKEIDQIASIFKGRAFLRLLSENAVSVITEGILEFQCDKLALVVAQLVYDRCKGVGIYPEISYSY